MLLLIGIAKLLWRTYGKVRRVEDNMVLAAAVLLMTVFGSCNLTSVEFLWGGIYQLHDYPCLILLFTGKSLEVPVPGAGSQNCIWISTSLELFRDIESDLVFSPFALLNTQATYPSQGV